MLDKTAIEANEAAKKVNWGRLDTQIDYYGKAITLPDDPTKMPLNSAIEALQRLQQQEMQEVRVHEVIDAYPLDAAVAFVKACKNLYGWAAPVTEVVKTFFGTQKNPPQIISVKTGHRDEDVVQCPIGDFKLPGVESTVKAIIGDYGKKDAKAFLIHALVRQKEKHILLELANETRRIVKEESIYRGKAIRLSVDYNGELDLSDPPTFLDVSQQNPLVFDDNIQRQIDDYIIVPLTKVNHCRRHGVSAQRKALLEGPFGTGKSEIMRHLAAICEQNGVTFILLDKIQGLKSALEFGVRYAPALVSGEDIDRITEVRDEEANDLVNTIDGVVSKTSKVMTVLTTNHVEKINQVMLRPGRLDVIISLRPPTDEAVKRLLMVFAGDLLSADADVSGAAKELSGQIPASIKECVERAKLSMIGRGDTKINDNDLVLAAQTMKNHLALLNREVAKETPAERLAKSLSEVVSNGSGDMLKTIQSYVEDTNRLTEHTNEMVRNM